MKRSRPLQVLVALAALLFFLPRRAAADTGHLDKAWFSSSSLSYSTNPVLDVSQLSDLSMQVAYASANISALSLTDGRPSTGTFTVLSTQSLSGLRLGLGSCVIDAGDAFTPVSTTSGTAQAISDAFNATPCLSGVASVHRGAGTSAVVFATATTIGTAGNSLAMFSNSSSVTVSGATLANGAASSFAISTDKVTSSSAHGMATGLPVLFATVSGTAPTGLTSGTTYFAIVSDQVTLQLAATSTGSLANLAVDITALTGGGSFTLTPTAFAGTYSFKWQASNDLISWFDVPVSSVTYSTPGNSFWDGSIDYKSRRRAFPAGTGGGLNIKAQGYGKKWVGQ